MEALENGTLNRQYLDQISDEIGERLELVWCLLNSWTFAAKDFLRRRGANDEPIRKTSLVL